MQILRFTILFFLLGWMANNVYAQTDKDQLAHTSLLAKPVTDTVLKPLVATVTKDSVNSVIKKKHDPRIATRRSAFIPGWGQAYNREYWKIPIVYGALAIPTVTFIYNNTWYKRTRDAYMIKASNDTARFGNIYPDLQKLDAASLQTYRNSFRKDRDYSILWFFILWGVNVVDATVFAHLKDFNVSSDLSMHVQPAYNPLTRTPSLNMAFNFKNPGKKPSSILTR